MAYTALTTVANIQAYFKTVVFSATTKPSTTDVSDWIDRATSIIYAKLSNQYVIEVTNVDDLLQLKELADMYVLTKIRQVLGISQPQLKNGKTMSYTEDQSEFFKILNMYDEGKLRLLNTDTNSSIIQTYSYNEANDICPVSSKSGTIW